MLLLKCNIQEIGVGLGDGHPGIAYPIAQWNYLVGLESGFSCFYGTYLIPSLGVSLGFRSDS
jgi:hypothetical protein